MLSPWSVVNRLKYAKVLIWSFRWSEHHCYSFKIFVPKQKQKHTFPKLFIQWVELNALRKPYYQLTTTATYEQRWIILVTKASHNFGIWFLTKWLIEVVGFHKCHLSVAIDRKIVVAAWELAGCRQIILKDRNNQLIWYYTDVRQVTVRWVKPFCTTITWGCVLAPKGFESFLNIPLITPPDPCKKKNYNHYLYCICYLK